MFYTGSRDGTVQIWERQFFSDQVRNSPDWGGYYPKQVLRGHSASITNLIVTSDELHLITSSQDESTRVWDTTTGEEIERLPGQMLGDGAREEAGQTSPHYKCSFSRQRKDLGGGSSGQGVGLE